MTSKSKRSKDDKTKFTEAEKNWNLEKLYEDLKAAKQQSGFVKRKVLTDTEKCHLRGLLCGYSPEKIANERGVGFGTVNDALSKTLYCYIEELLEYKKKIRHWGDVSDFLEKAGYKIQVSEQFQPSHPLADKKENTLETSHNIEVNSIREWRFKSVDQLWSKDIGECISGIRKLERIAKDYPIEHWAIMEELAEFIRIRTCRKERDEERSPKLLEDIQAALTVIGRRDIEKDPEKQKLDLSKVDIVGANLSEAKLPGAILREANLQGVNFDHANLQGAILKKANLQEASFYNTNLQEAHLWKAHFPKANFMAVNLQRAILSNAIMQEVNLRGANLQNASLTIANLTAADLKGADFKGANLQGANFMGANLQEVDFAESKLQGTKFQGADLTNAKNLDSQKISSAFGDSTTVLPENVERPARWM